MVFGPPKSKYIRSATTPYQPLPGGAPRFATLGPGYRCGAWPSGITNRITRCWGGWKNPKNAWLNLRRGVFRNVLGCFIFHKTSKMPKNMTPGSFWKDWWRIPHEKNKTYIYIYKFPESGRNVLCIKGYRWNSDSSDVLGVKIYQKLTANALENWPGLKRKLVKAIHVQVLSFREGAFSDYQKYVSTIYLSQAYPSNKIYYNLSKY